MRPQKPISEEECKRLQQLLKETKTKSDFRRVQCVVLRAELGLTSPQIAKVIGWSVGRIKQIHSRYFKDGEESLIGVGRGGRRNENMSIEEEDSFLKDYLEEAKAGGVLVVTDIKASYEKEIGHKVPSSTVYRMLNRHGWRKILPRSRHPKADLEKQEAFKKTSYNSKGRSQETEKRKRSC